MTYGPFNRPSAAQIASAARNFSIRNSRGRHSMAHARNVGNRLQNVHRVLRPQARMRSVRRRIVVRGPSRFRRPRTRTRIGYRQH